MVGEVSMREICNDSLTDARAKNKKKKKQKKSKRKAKSIAKLPAFVDLSTTDDPNPMFKVPSYTTKAL
jgi:hypothetical protein